MNALVDTQLCKVSRLIVQIPLLRARLQMFIKHKSLRAQECTKSTKSMSHEEYIFISTLEVNDFQCMPSWFCQIPASVSGWLLCCLIERKKIPQGKVKGGEGVCV